jgi:hypothetical protein
MALSKKWTLKDCVDSVRVSTNEVRPDAIQEYSIIKYISLAVSEVAEMLNGASAPDYGAIVSLPITSLSASLEGLYIDRVIKVTDTGSNLIAERKDFEFENLKSIDSFKRSVMFNHFGETLYFFTGSLTTLSPTVNLYYYRQPTVATSSADYLDVRDKYIPLVIAKAKASVYEQLNTTPPEALTEVIKSRVAEIKQSTGEKVAVIDARKK